jgi:hypothetical protein
MTFNNCYKYLGDKFVEWHKLSGGNLPNYIQNYRDDIRSHLDDSDFKTIFCNFFSNLSEQELNQQFNTVIKITKQLSPVPPVSLTQAEINILTGIMLEICGNKAQAEKLIATSLGFILAAIVINAFTSATKNQRKVNKTRRVQKTTSKGRNRKLR